MENENYGSFNFITPPTIQKCSDTEQSLSFFSHAQNKANENICLLTAHLSNNICENLCFSSDFSYDLDANYELLANNVAAPAYNHQKNKECKSICKFASDMQVEEDCPFQKRCPNGCPCPGYKCQEEVMDFNLARVGFGRYNQISSTFYYKISLQPGNLKFDKLSTSVLERLSRFAIKERRFTVELHNWGDTENGTRGRRGRGGFCSIELVVVFKIFSLVLEFFVKIDLPCCLS